MLGIVNQGNTYARRIASVRKVREVTQRQLAAATGLHEWVIAAIESDRRSIRLAEAVVICRALGVDIGTLVSEEPMVVRVEVPMESASRPRRTELADLAPHRL